MQISGGAGIRTQGTLARPAVFKTVTKMPICGIFCAMRQFVRQRLAGRAFLGDVGQLRRVGCQNSVRDSRKVRICRWDAIFGIPQGHETYGDRIANELLDDLYPGGLTGDPRPPG